MINISNERELRQINHDITTQMRQYVLFAIFEDNKHYCFDCKCTDKPLEIHHKRYGLDVNIYDLEILCHDCHKLKNNYTRLDYRTT